jgi:hypothetical protein
MRLAFWKPRIAVPTTMPDTTAVVINCALRDSVTRWTHDDMSSVPHDQKSRCDVHLCTEWIHYPNGYRTAERREQNDWQVIGGDGGGWQRWLG